MKKLLSLAVLAAALGASVGCDDKKTTGGTPTKVSPTGSPTKAGS
jgi:hypothetical protein